MLRTDINNPFARPAESIRRYLVPAEVLTLLLVN